MIRVSALYPNEPGKRFDFDYYVDRHMELVRERLQDFGLVGIEVDRCLASGDGSSPAFVCVGHVLMRDLDEFLEGMDAHSADIFADVPNYTDIEPQMIISEIVDDEA